MDGPNFEHSDSDSGESWTMLDHSPSHADEAPEFPGSPGSHEGETEAADQTDRDDDTDGISIISDSETETSTPHGLKASDQDAAECGDCPTEQHSSRYISDSLQVPQPINKLENIDKNIRSQHDILEDSNGKMRTYVHRRNKRLSTVLNIIVLGSLITAAGVAIGHMWGARDDCAAPPAPAVNKILSNLYKLQEENAYLRTKLEELTVANSLLIQQQKTNTKKKNMKGFDDNLAKCAAFDYCSLDKVLQGHLVEPEFEKDFLSDINKLKTVYEQNRSWLDEDVAKRQRYEKFYQKKMKSSLKAAMKAETNKEINPETDEIDKLITIEDESHIYTTTESPEDNISERKNSYADSLKTDNKNSKINKRSIQEVGGYELGKETSRKKKSKRQLDVIPEKSLSDDEIIKDNRYNGMKHKEEKKKNRQKTNKKQKRGNKYEQWEMKGGYLKDYDDISVASSQDASAGASPKLEKESSDFVFNINDANENQNESTARYNSDEKPKKNGKDNSNWYDKRVSQRSEARRKLEQEMFGGERGERGGAGWYFRRARRRELGRDAHNPAHTAKRNRNYKTKQ